MCIPDSHSPKSDHHVDGLSEGCVVGSVDTATGVAAVVVGVAVVVSAVAEAGVGVDVAVGWSGVGVVGVAEDTATEGSGVTAAGLAGLEVGVRSGDCAGGLEAGDNVAANAIKACSASSSSRAISTAAASATPAERESRYARLSGREASRRRCGKGTVATHRIA